MSIRDEHRHLFNTIGLFSRIIYALVKRWMYLLFYGMWKGQMAVTITYKSQIMLIAVIKNEYYDSGDGRVPMPVVCKVFFDRESVLPPEGN